MNTPLVSICSPCYNVAPYIGRFLDSLIEQTYKHLEIILVNDGSTDATKHVIEKHIPRLHHEGYAVKVVDQPNGGLASAINTALKHATGKYITWPDPDDWLTPNSIECRVRLLEAREDVALVRGHMAIWDETNNKSRGSLNSQPSHSGPYVNLFEDSLHSSISMAALTNMVRAESLDQVIPNREIYVAKTAGQNWQIILPIAYTFPCWHLQCNLGYYFVRSDSHSHQKRTYEQIIELTYVIQQTLITTLQTIPDIPEKYPIWAVRKYSYERLCHAKHHKKRADVWKFAKEFLAVTPRLGEKIKVLCEVGFHVLVSPIFSK